MHTARITTLRLLFSTFLTITFFSAITAASAATTSMQAAHAAEPIISGYRYEHDSTVLKQPRRYMVSLPEGYYSSDRKYPTLYVIDGDFQFQHTSALVTNLTRMGKIAPMIVIGIANQGPSDYVFTTTWPAENNDEFGGAALFYRYITQELLPVIHQDFRTNNQQALAGYSLGGLFTAYAMMQENTPFNAFLAMSPSAWYEDYALVNKLSGYLDQAIDKQNKNIQAKALPHFFISVANEEEMGVDKVITALTDKIAKRQELKQWHWQFKSYPNETHFSTALPALNDALIFLSPNFYIDPQNMMKMQDFNEVIDAFEQKKINWAGFQIEWLQAYQLAKYMFWSKQTDETEAFLAQIKQHFPESYTEVVVQMATGFNKKQQPEKAQNLLKTVEKSGMRNTMWYREMAVAYEALNNIELANKYRQQAFSLAKKQQLSTWQVWELH